MLYKSKKNKKLNNSVILIIYNFIVTMLQWNKICVLLHKKPKLKYKKMTTSTHNPRLEKIMFLIDSNHFSLKIDENPSRDKIERIKMSIARKQQLFEKTIAHYKKENNELEKG